MHGHGLVRVSSRIACRSFRFTTEAEAIATQTATFRVPARVASRHLCSHVYCHPFHIREAPQRLTGDGAGTLPAARCALIHLVCRDRSVGVLYRISVFFFWLTMFGWFKVSSCTSYWVKQKDHDKTEVYNLSALYTFSMCSLSARLLHALERRHRQQHLHPHSKRHLPLPRSHLSHRTTERHPVRHLRVNLINNNNQVRKGQARMLCAPWSQ